MIGLYFNGQVGVRSKRDGVRAAHTQNLHGRAKVNPRATKHRTKQPSRDGVHTVHSHHKKGDGGGVPRRRTTLATPAPPTILPTSSLLIEDEDEDADENVVNV